MVNIIHTLKSGEVVCYKTKGVESMRKIMKKMKDDAADRGFIGFYHFECPKCYSRNVKEIKKRMAKESREWRKRYCSKCHNRMEDQDQKGKWICVICEEESK